MDECSKIGFEDGDPVSASELYIDHVAGVTGKQAKQPDSGALLRKRKSGPAYNQCGRGLGAAD